MWYYLTPYINMTIMVLILILIVNNPQVKKTKVIVLNQQFVILLAIL